VTNSSESKVAAGPSLDTFRGVSRVERALLPFLREPTLWPVFAVLVAHAVVIIAPMLVLVWRERLGWSIVGLALFATPSLLGIVVEIRDRGRPQLLSALIVTVWGLCVLGAWAGMRAEIL
jgi:hypothetical protein